MRIKDIITESEQLTTSAIDSFLINLKELLGKSRTNKWDDRPTGDEAFRAINRRQFIGLKRAETSATFSLTFPGYSDNRVGIDLGLIEKAFTKANTSGATLYVSVENGQVPRQRDGKVSGGAPVTFTVSTVKIPNPTFVLGGSISPNVMQQIKNDVPAKSSNGYGYLKDIKSDGDNIIISYAYTMAGQRDRHPLGGPSKEYDAKIIAAMDEYQQLAQSLSAKYNINVIPKEVAW
jgi:hypothetical protein